MSREYRVSVGMYVYYVAFSLVWFGGLFGFVLLPEVPHDAGLAHVCATLGLLAFACAPAVVTALLPYRATLDDYGTLELRSALRTRRLRVAQIRAIEWDEEYIYLRGDGRKAFVLADENFRDLLARILVLNPAINVDDASRKLIGTPT